MFAFTSMGGKVDDSINRKGKGPYVFHLHGQTYHSMGSLLPKAGESPKFAQLYIYDTENEVENRARALSSSSLSLGPSNSKKSIDRNIIREVKDVLDTSSKDNRTYNLPTANEVVGLIVGDFDTCQQQRDIVIEKHREGPSESRKIIFRGGRLFQQFLVDGYTMVETERLFFHRAKQSKLRCDTYTNIRQSIAAGNNDPTLLGKPVVLSFSFTGGPRYMKQNYMDAMALCTWYGCPDLFITVTCNPNWPEISRYMREHNLSSTDRHDVLTRLFKMKLDQLMKDVKELHLFGRTQAAEIPDKDDDPDLYKLVSDFMMHGPCGVDEPNQACMADGKCTKHFPKKFTQRSSVDAEGYPVYRRRDDRKYVEKNGHQLHNGYVVPYNATLLKRYQCHINVEWCNQTGSIKYLFKYINKGPDRVSAQLYEPVTTEDGQQVQKPVDEIKAFFDCRYLSACEAAWRIFGFETHYRTPYVEVSPTREQQVVYYENYDLETVIHKPSVCQSMFEGWMKMNELYPAARELTYVEFPTKYVWNAPKRIWTLRKQGKSVGRIHGVPISTGDAYYCRMLLNSAKRYDKEYVESIKDVAHWAPAEQLRELFVTLLSQKELTTPLTVWLQTWHLLAHVHLIISDDGKKNVCLFYVEELLRSRGSSLRQWPEMPYPNTRRGLYFVYGYGGTGKTFLWKTLAAGIRRQGDIVLNVASSGIASLLMSGGRTAHSRFHIPIKVDETSHCSISAQSDLGALLKRCKLIIWDEAPMANKLCFEALDRSLRDILRQNRQVVPKGSRQDIVSASLKESYLWDHCNVLKLTANMRLTVGARPEDVSEIQEFIIYIKYIINVLFVS
ncbi:hypothetical protein Tco_0390276 [Tanacetum coccineum]